MTNLAQMQTEEIEQLIESGMKTEIVRVKGDGKHFTAIIVSPEFADKTRIDRQRLVFATLQQALATDRLHAITLKTFTPDEWNHTDKE
jgi:acid stress-induced BolA-like protein IbaG/YrbA